MITGGKLKQVGRLVQICTGIEMMKTKYGSACKAVPGYDVKIIKSDQTLAKPNEMGDIAVSYTHLTLPTTVFV